MSAICWRCERPIALKQMPYCLECKEQQDMIMYMPMSSQKLYSIAQFNRDLDRCIGHHDVQRAITESNFRLMFGDKDPKKKIIVFVSIKGSILVYI